ncbi:MAG: response regulator transcription factor [Suilimivivens sp.]
MRILIIEDEKALADALVEILKQNHYTADVICDGIKGLDYGRSEIYDLILLDIMLPGMDGLTILKTLRRELITTPIILLTAKSEVSDIIAGLDAGSDDYLAKPFSTGELLARIRALSRRNTTYNGEILAYGDLAFNKSTMELSCGSESMKLGLKEAQLIELLLSNSRQVMPKNLLIEKIWGLDSNTEYNNIEVYISFLRQKMNFLGTHVQIRTVRGVGYQLEA